MPVLLPLLAATALATGVVEPDLPGLVTVADYPAEALATGRSVAATIEIRVSPNGRPIGCKVVGAVGEAALANTVCSIAMQKRYSAARLLNGSPAHARVTTMVRLYVPGGTDAAAVAAARLAPDYQVKVAPTPGTAPITDVRMVLEVNRKGKVTQCGAKDEAQIDLSRAICKARAIFHVDPLQDERGRAVPYVTEATVRIHAAP